MFVVDGYQKSTSAGAGCSLLRCLFGISSMVLRFFFVIEANKGRGRGMAIAIQVLAKYNYGPKNLNSLVYN
jgi:hypothetical protein